MRVYECDNLLIFAHDLAEARAHAAWSLMKAGGQTTDDGRRLVPQIVDDPSPRAWMNGDQVALLLDIAHAVIPSTCSGCGLWDVEDFDNNCLCPDCRPRAKRRRR